MKKVLCAGCDKQKGEGKSEDEMKGGEREMKTKIALIILAISIALTCAAFILSITISPVVADRGVIVPSIDIPVFESEQKAIVAWNGSVETLIISTDVNAAGNSTALEILPLPSNPEKIEAGDLESFNQTQNLIELHAPITSRYGEDVPGSPALNITFQEKIGAHNITVVDVNDAQEFVGWMETFLGNNGIEYNISSTRLEPLVANYINRGINFFVFDLIELNTSERSVEPIVYQFDTNFMYYPLEISSLASGNTEISLFTVTNERIEKSCVSTAGFDIVNYTWKGYGYPRPRPVPVEFEINEEELGNISSCVAELFEGDAWFTAWRYNGSIENFDGDFRITASASVATPPTPFVIYGWVNYDIGYPVNDPTVAITNLNTSEVFDAETDRSSNYYQVLTSSWNVSTDDMLHFNVSDNGNVAEFHRSVTQEDINRGGIFDFNITLEVPEVLPIFDTGKPANPYPSIFGTHNGTITPYVTIYNVSKLYTYSCQGTGGHTEYVAFYYDPNRTKKITEGYWEGYAAGDWHNITFHNFTLQAGHTYYYTIKTGSYPQIHHTDELPAEEGMGIINCTSFVDANGHSYDNWIPAIRLEGSFLDPNITLIGDIKANPEAYEGKIVKIAGENLEWNCFECGPGPPETRSDWCIGDETGCIYVTGSCWRNYGKFPKIEGMVKIYTKLNFTCPYIDMRWTVDSVELSCHDIDKTVKVNETANYTIIVTNTESARDTFNLTVINANNASSANLSMNSITIDAGANGYVVLEVADETAGRYNVAVTAIPQRNKNNTDIIKTYTTVIMEVQNYEKGI